MERYQPEQTYDLIVTNYQQTSYQGTPEVYVLSELSSTYDVQQLKIRTLRRNKQKGWCDGNCLILAPFTTKSRKLGFLNKNVSFIEKLEIIKVLLKALSLLVLVEILSIF